jgi:Holliday junction resolvase
MNGSQYEREFRGILEADEDMLQKITKSCSVLERENYFRVTDQPFAVVRAAGSLGIDLVAVRGDVSFLIEIKTSSSPTLHFSSMSGKLQQQAESMKELCEKTATLPVYAYRLKRYRGDSWRIFTLDHSKLQGRLRIVHQRLPPLSQSSNGNYIMRWDDGMPLSDFLNYICNQK